MSTKWEFPEFGLSGVQPISTVNKIEKAYEEGYQDGIAAGFLQAKNVVEEQLNIEWKEKNEQLNKSINSLNKVTELIDKELENQLINLVMTITRHLFRNEVKMSPQQLSPIIHEAIALLPQRVQSIEIQLNPVDEQHLRQYCQAENDCISDQFKINPQLERGDIIVQCGQSTIDATLDNRIQQLVEGMLSNG